MSTSVLTCNEEIRAGENLHLSDAEVFKACDDYLQTFENTVSNWPALAKACIEVRDRIKFPYAGFKSWTAWIHARAPQSARTVFSHIRLFDDLKEDYTPTEMSEMPPETAKVVRTLPKSIRRKNDVVAASKRPRKQFVEEVKKAYPTQLLETIDDVKLLLPESLSKLFHDTVVATRTLEEDPELSYERCVEIWILSWRNECYGEPESGVNNFARASQIAAMAAKAGSFQ